MKLELKHLAGYLPYRLKGNFEVSEVVPSVKFELRKKELRADNIDFFLSYAKPILRPLSDLTKEIEVDCEKFVPCVELNKIHPTKATYFEMQEGIIDSIKVDCLTSWVQNKLLEWHFDIYGLIETGLAIDKKTIL